MHVQPPGKPPRLYSWSSLAVGDEPLAVGATDDLSGAFAHAADALRAAPVGARALVHEVRPSYGRIAYVYERLLARGRYDPDAGAVAWEELPARTSITALAPAVTDGVPPEAIAAGLADAATDEERQRLLEQSGAFAGQGR